MKANHLKLFQFEYAVFAVKYRLKMKDMLDDTEYGRIDEKLLQIWET